MEWLDPHVQKEFVLRAIALLLSELIDYEYMFRVYPKYLDGC